MMSRIKNAGNVVPILDRPKGAIARPVQPDCNRRLVPILDRPKGAIAHCNYRFSNPLDRWFQSSIAPKGQSHQAVDEIHDATDVPILDRPKGAIAQLGSDQLQPNLVPILDRPKGAIALKLAPLAGRLQCSNPRSPQRGNRTREIGYHGALWSSNPRSPQRGNRTLVIFKSLAAGERFQSSIAPKGQSHGRISLCF